MLRDDIAEQGILAASFECCNNSTFNYKKIKEFKYTLEIFNKLINVFISCPFCVLLVNYFILFLQIM